MQKTLLSKRYILLYAVIAGFLMSLTPFSLAFLPNRHGPSHQDVQLLDAFMLLFLNIALFFGSLWLNIVIIEKSRSKKIMLNVLAYFVFTLLAILIHKPIWSMLERLPIGFFIRDEFVRNLIIFSISAIVANAFHSFQQNQLMKNKILEIQRQSLAGQIESLKQQINPHFFFNSLNTLSGLAQENSQKTVEFIEKLSLVFRYVLEIQEKNVVSIVEEMDFAKAYIYLLKVRFENKFSIQIHLSLSNKVVVPTLCTHLLLENCFKHNAMSAEKPLEIEINADKDYLSIRNSIAKINQNTGTGIGLENLNKRCILLSGKPIEVSNDTEYFVVKVPTIQIKNENNIN